MSQSNASATFVPTRFNRTLRRSEPVATLAQADGATLHCEPGTEAAAVAAVRAKALSFGLTPYTPKGQSEAQKPVALGPSRRIPGYVALALNFTRPDHAQVIAL